MQKLSATGTTDLGELERILKQIEGKGGILIVTDGVFSMSGDIANLPEIVRLARKYGARVMVDDAHGLGVLGEGGRGTANHFGLDDEVDIYMGTFSKSLASLGGYMAAKAEVVDYVKHASRRVHLFGDDQHRRQSCAVALAALRYLKAHPEIVSRLRSLSDYARRGYKAKGIRIIEASTPIIPIYTYEVENTIRKAHDIYEDGVYLNPVLPPATPAGRVPAENQLHGNPHRAAS